MANSSSRYSVLTAAHWGPMLVETDGETVFSSHGALATGMENSLQSAVRDQVHSNTRVRFPMVRKGFLASPENPQGRRGHDEFVRVRCDEALDHSDVVVLWSANPLNTLKIAWNASDEQGLSYFSALRDSGKKLICIDPMRSETVDFFGDKMEWVAPHMGTDVALMLGIAHTLVENGWHDEAFIDPMRSETVDFFGDKMEWVAPHMGTDVALMLGIAHTLVENGWHDEAFLDPMRSETVDFFGDKMEWVAPHMGTDVALMLGIAHTLVENGWHDEAFLTRCTTGYAVFASYLLGESDGIAKTAEWAAGICGVNAEKIRELAALFHQNTTMLMAGWGMQRQQFGEQKHWMIVTLAAMLGQIGTPGGGFGLSYHFANGGNPTRRAAVLSSMQGSLPGGTDAVDKIPVARIVEALENPGGAYQHNGMDRHFPDIRFIWWAGGANFTHHQDTNRLIRAWQKPELVVISECFWTAAAKHADIVLPATTSFERNDLTMTGDYSNQHLVPMKQVVPPRDDARNDFDVFAELSERWEKGGYARFTEGKSELQWLETFYNVARQRGASQQVELPPFAEFWQAKQCWGKSAHPAAVLVFLIILPMVVTPRGVLRCSLPCRAACRVAAMRWIKSLLPALLKHWKTLVAHINTTV